MLIFDLPNVKAPLPLDTVIFFKSLANNARAVKLPMWICHPGPFAEIRKAIEATGVRGNPLRIDEARELLPWILQNLSS